MTVNTAIRQGSSLLEAARIPVPRLTAEVLLCHALRCERSFLYGHSEDTLSEVAWIHYGRYLHERLQGKPTQYITKRQEFYGHEFRVTPDVLIPRPETEHLVEAAIPMVREARRVVDVGCGSGAIAITLSLAGATDVIATDVSGEALKVARENAERLQARVQFIQCDLLSPIGTGSVDVVVSNPPYVPTEDEDSLQREVRCEPRIALFGGPGGLENYRRITAEAERVLRPGGWLLFELGFRSSEAVREMVAAWSEVEVTPDLAGIPRVLRARKPT
jgi:release factor glutamine methyltransferase